MARTIWVTFLLVCLVCPSQPQLPRMTLDTPRIGEAVQLANYLLQLPTGPRSERKECRLLTNTERQRLFNAIVAAKEDTRARPNMLDAFAFLHSHAEVNVGAHGGASFLPFHRVLIYLYEKLLRMYEPRVSLCFWDSSLEPNDYTASAMWSADLFGTARGVVNTGFAANWLTPIGPLIREVAAESADGRPLNVDDIESILEQRSLGEISFPNGRMSHNLEELHNHVHVYCGGMMGRIETAAYDPLFWFHHTYVDCLFEEFRENQNRSGINPQRDWPADYGDDEHAPFAPMRLGALRNIDGQNNYLSQRIRCEKVPECRTNQDCGRFMNCVSRRCQSNTLRTPAVNNNPGFGNMFGQNPFGGMFGGQQNMLQALLGGQGGVPGFGGGMQGFGGQQFGNPMGQGGPFGGGGFPGQGGFGGFQNPFGGQGFGGFGGQQGFGQQGFGQQFGFGK